MNRNGTLKIYTCPMHPEVRRDMAGICPECGMNLVPLKEKSRKHEHPHDYDKHAGHSMQMFLRKFWVSLILTIPVVIYSDLPQLIFNWSPPPFSGSNYLSFVLGSIVFFTAAGSF